MAEKRTTLNNFAYRIIETFGIQAIQLIISIVLARLLIPENYGVVAIASTIVTILTSVVQSSFNAPLVQKRELTKIDLTSSFYVMLAIAGTLYFILFAGAPTIADVYGMPDLALVIRVLGLVLIIGSWNSIQMALVYRNLKFRASMLINVVGIIVQGIVGIGMAYKGFGVWSLVSSQITYQIVIGILYGIYNKWIPGICFSIQSIKDIWKIGIPLCGAELLTIVSSNVYPMIIGLRYTKAELGLYQKGNSVPTTIVNGVVTACSTVFFSMMSRVQDDYDNLKQLLRNGVAITSYLIVPIALGLLGISKDFITVVLGENWLNAIPLMQIACLTLSLYPLRIRTQAIKAIGKANQSFFTNAAYAAASNGLLLIFVFVSLRAAIFSMFLAEVVFAITTGFYISKDFGYTFDEQIRDVASSYISGALMAVIVLCVGEMFSAITLWSLLIKVLAGVVSYILISLIAKPKPVRLVLSYLRIGNR
ncbi:lipopolysaccharide biosynthesis protein [Ruthenibacterium lactatiformans]|uniref:Oligosaccharide flippase family protein n=1 Tax=Ruthenibacterium lactatiformans TaxID=1550024 RepID=A0A6I3QQU7_9FIRM|nr:lipopolysaccharide biosynthesis protein [Ruthenibacterium lactatiformans]RGD20615.1 lipopolysaccharide biosynthesis protein [Subdoligranulum sp. AM23-21AC]MTQ81848.1 oligosaccharide flippase family protein [Ruthenibacterium lactatiformans]MTS16678.1 oligosaccharide flippase family protein [Ruthenibacterium lactatiformans]MTS20408.1 oligosaccharide flippase family protein [Ruthenibacterium lactatiformans]MTS20982.1 oligosaccharide flippase family protein [Ruthenibacterium lactatiformans]